MKRQRLPTSTPEALTVPASANHLHTLYRLNRPKILTYHLMAPLALWA